MMKSAQFWNQLSQIFRQVEPCKQGWALLGDPLALEQHQQMCLPCRKLHAAQYLARNTQRYLRMERTPTGLQPRLYVSPNLPGYIRIELPAILPQVYAAGNTYRGQQWAQQAVSEDEQLLITLRRGSNARWELTARYLPGARWQVDEAGIARPVQESDEATESPECLACLIIDSVAGVVQTRLVGWFVQEGEAYVARLRLPLARPVHTPSQIEVGLIPSRALRWLTPDERSLSHQCALHPEAQARWEAWLTQYVQ